MSFDRQAFVTKVDGFGTQIAIVGSGTRVVIKVDASPDLAPYDLSRQALAMKKRRRLGVEALETRWLLSVTSPSVEDTLADLAFRTWAPDGSTATLVDPGTSIVSMEYQVSTTPNSQALLRGTYSEQDYPDGVDFSCGVTIPLRSDSPSLFVTFHDVLGAHRSHHIDNAIADPDATVYFLPDDFANFGNVRKIDFTVADDLESGALHIGVPSVPTEADSPTTDETPDSMGSPTESETQTPNETDTEADTETTNPADSHPSSTFYAAMSFHAWAPDGSSATLTEAVDSQASDSLVTLDYQIGELANAMAMLNGTFSEDVYPTGVDLDDGLAVRMRSSASSVAVLFRHVDGQVSHQRLEGLSADAFLLQQLLPDAESGPIRKLQFLIADKMSSGTLEIDFAAEASPAADDGQAVEDSAEDAPADPAPETPPADEETPTPPQDPGEPDIPQDDTTDSATLLQELAFRAWAPVGSSAIFSQTDALAVLDYQVADTSNAMAMLRGTFPEADFPNGVDLSGGVTFRMRSGATSVLVNFHDTEGRTHHRWLDRSSPDDDTLHAFLPDELAELGPIRKIDFIIVEEGTAGTLSVNPVIVDPPEASEPEDDTTPPTPAPDDPCSWSHVECIRAGDETRFQQTIAAAGESKHFYIFPDALLSGLNIVDRSGDEYHFIDGSHVVGNVQTPGPWTIDRGVINITNSSNLLISGLTATNEFQYQAVSSTVDVQSSTALNISWSHEIVVENANLAGNGKSTVWIQGNSTVELRNTQVKCYYFCVGIAASDVTTKNLSVSQFNPIVTGDKHAMFWVSSTMRSAVDNRFYGNSNVVFEDTVIHKQTGEGMVVGNGGYDYRSHVTFRGTTQVVATEHVAHTVDAWLPIHRNYNGITLQLAGVYPSTSIDLATAPDTFGRFLIHSYGPDEAPPYVSPLIVCIDQSCVSSNDVLDL